MWRILLTGLSLTACHLGDSGLIDRTCEDLWSDCGRADTSDVTGHDTDTGELEEEVDEDGDGYLSTEDCDDTNAEVHPEADEICDGVDNDCDEAIDAEDDDLSDGFEVFDDADGDGFGLPGSSQIVCEQGSAQVTNDQDCNDEDASAYPGAPEICDGTDSNCDGLDDAGLISMAGTNYDTISAALAAAPANASIMVCDGEWSESLEISSSVSLISQGGASVTSLRGDGESAVVAIQGGEVRIEGFTLTGGGGGEISWWSAAGGAISMDGGSLTLSESIVSDNTADIGGALFAGQDADSVSIVDSVIESNEASQYCGALFSYVPTTISGTVIRNNSGDICGSVGAYGVEITVSESTIRDNLTSNEGGGLWLVDASLTLSGSLLQANQASTDGGGVYMIGGSMTCEGVSSIQSNIASSLGGGVFLEGAAVTDCTISGNSAYYGGGVASNTDSSQITGGSIESNTAIVWGGGLYLGETTMSMDSVDVSANEASYGGGLYIIDDSSLTLTGGSITGNTAVTLGGGLRLASGSIEASLVDFGVGVNDNSPDDLAVSGVSTSYTSLGSNTSFSCTVSGTTTDCSF